MKVTIPSRSKPDNLVLRVLTARDVNISQYINAQRSLSGVSSDCPIETWHLPKAFLAEWVIQD